MSVTVEASADRPGYAARTRVNGEHRHPRALGRRPPPYASSSPRSPTTVSAAPPPPLALGELPDAVRVRVVALAADALPEVVRLPPALRRVAGFAPQRRALLGVTAIAEALGADDELRERIGTQVADRTSYDATPAASQVTGDPAEVAALAWLVRPEGWEQLV